MRIKLLNTEFTKTNTQGYTRHFMQVEKTPGYAIYKVTYITPQGSYEYYEGFLLRTVKAHFIDPSYDMTELYPGNEAFGVWAWTFWSLDQARNTLIEKLNQHNTHGENS